jgi:aminoglycoside phosphotransferase (APT) family kinase protein
MTTPGRLIASGRDADIFECGPGLVLRRSRVGRSMEAEARVMQHVKALGYPVPAVDGISDDGLDLEMERIDGRDMVATIERRPWTIARQGRLLADLHRRLHDLPAPDWLPAAPVGAGDRLLHLDLHPLNVILGPKGPVVIDWTGAARGDPAIDVALSWVLMDAGSVPTGRLIAAVLGRARGVLIDNFLAPFDLDPVRRNLRPVVGWKVSDPHMSSAEQARMWKLVESAGSPEVWP